MFSMYYVAANSFRLGDGQDGDPEAEERPWHGQSLRYPPLRRRRRRAGAVPGPPAQVDEPPPAPPAPRERGGRPPFQQGVGAGDLPDDNVGRDMVALDSEAGAVAAGVPFQAPQHDAPVRVRQRPVAGHRACPREGLLPVEARRPRQPRLRALHGT